MLPFLQPKKAVGVIISRRGKDLLDAKPEVNAPGVESNSELESACEDILRAIDERSVKGLAAAMQAAYEVCGDMPSESLDDDKGEQE